MCIILVGKVTRPQYEAAVKQNGDGFSLFTKELGLVKAPSKEQVKRALGTFGVWHFRIGTSGKKDVSNVHPFKICGGEWLLYHNGVLGDGKGDKSDTACLAELLANVPYSVARATLTSLSAGNKFLMVKASDPMIFIPIGSWEVDAGVLMSHVLYYGGKVPPKYIPGRVFSLKDVDGTEGGQFDD
jgi:hypothetical protein